MNNKALRLVLIALTMFAGVAHAADDNEAARVAAGTGWKQPEGGIPYHVDTLRARAPWITLWQRIDVKGAAVPFKVLVNCRSGAILPYALLDADLNVVPFESAAAQDWRYEQGSPQDKTVKFVCNAYGYYS